MEGLQLNLSLEKDKKAEQRVKEVVKKVKASDYEPTWEEVWHGYVNPISGKAKKGILQLKNSDSDLVKLKAVKEAVEKEEIGTNVTTLKKFSKTHALGLHAVLMEARKDEIIKHMIENKPANYHLVDTVPKLKRLCELLSKEDIIALDTETNGLYHEHHTVGMSMTLPKADLHFYVPYRHECDCIQLKPDIVFMMLKPYLESLDLVLFNAKFDYKKLYKDGIKLNHIKADVLIMMFLLNENEPSLKLKDLAKKYGHKFGYEEPTATYEELFGNCGFENTPLDIGHIYACKDTHLTWLMYKWLLSYLDTMPDVKKVFFDIEMRLLPVILKMELRGYNVDLDYAEEYKNILEKEVSEMESKLETYFPNINLNSGQQLANFLFNELGLERVKGDSVDKDVLEALEDKYEGIKVLREYRKTYKLLHTYIEPLPKLVWEDGFLHGEFDQIGTKTGRLSSKNPNMQNLDPRARKIFVAPEGKLYMSVDFSKMEVFLACELSGDPNLYEALHGGYDVYSVLASKSYGLPIEECGDGTIYRKHSKTALLGCMYGALPFTIAKQVNVSVEEGQQILDSFFDGNPVLTESIHKCHKMVAERGFVTTITGRKRRFNDIPKKVKLLQKINAEIKRKTGMTGDEIAKKYGSIYKYPNAKKLPYELKKQYHETNKVIQKAFRQSFNATVQGSGGDITKIAMINLDKYFTTELNPHLPEKDWFRCVGSIHDEVLLEVPENITKEQIDRIDYIMCNTMPLKVKMRTDIEFYKRYYHDGKSAEQVLNGDLPQK